MTTDLLTAREAAERLKLSESYLEKARIRGDGPRFVRLGRSIRYRPEDIEAWVASRAAGSTSEYGASA